MKKLLSVMAIFAVAAAVGGAVILLIGKVRRKC